ncbi:pyridoxal 5'-phosphate synthase glutaminase subunit PdxT [Chloroflexus aggregans]|uniref:Pyridoxal 5'-phosphate synthase subunit PdxT n=1 Tax=Chloroflexus aggregans (strain MD-66 / DSM 9485) TaxID=326427 RepID=PDXT_CHLAD|nr:pyridoxal 5'-phosphate synthase glutaminase subunit PdxT [Chloroflexus aggregans]B8G664.1 RecName: Full=Pyridoxal 5'-phosphate synthase subunit PdxT; AltName: Full=Pdx2; AltName: Full=Pyridoxal 5'-phosphate synthase glutaminase subunit [Chloroflexus aggregans DSM 9485]ACL25797.1 SNO glutamine amidotransferase [Chloroflexus aggregans DSM 9485]
MTVGVLALQGDFREHCAVLRRIGVEPIEVRLPHQLAQVDHLIIPGGESTTIGRLLAIYQMLEPIRTRGGCDLAIWGTCAGAILLANEVMDQKQGGQPTLGLMNLTIRRNAYGSQLDSFEAPITMPIIGEEPLPGVFIRAPQIMALGQGCEAVGWLEDGSVVAARQGRLLATTFHPELTHDDRVHRLFLEL